jgi:hypothetical protein
MNRWMLGSAFAIGLATTAFAADDIVVEIDGLKSKAPASWKNEKPKMNRVAQFKITKSDGDPEDAELVVFHFGKGQGGDVDANMKRWKGQFKTPGEKSKEEKLKVSGVEVMTLDMQGTYLHKSAPMDPDSKVVEKPNFRAINVYFNSENGPYFIKLVGPAKTVEVHKAEFDAWLKAFK